ncbi:MAG: hypothetical protein HGN29_14615 [Asgard group archaeon]|nr:hypothetical protein [Asgard group archaeon]
MTVEESKTNESEIKITCTWDEESNCIECEGADKLLCKWDKKRIVKFYVIYFLFTFPSWYGLILLRYWAGIGVFALTYLVFTIAYFIFIEMYVLCSHCPYYSRKGKILYCQSSKHGMPKIWEYKPGPLKIWEKIVTLTGMLFFLLFPVITISYGFSSLWNNESAWNEGSYAMWKLIILLFLDILSVIFGFMFVIVLKKRFCSQCVNFSCPLNTVSKEFVDVYLKNNPVMKKAWEEAGYKIS